jgi:hypothetical protein
MREIPHAMHLSDEPPPPRAPSRLAPPQPALNAQRHLHHIAVETGSEPVWVAIGPREGEHSAPDEGGSSGLPGGHAPIPGGFAKFFNRVIDCGAWACLPDAARAVYLPMVRFADARDAFRVRIGLAALMKYTALSRSSVKRGLRALLEWRLITIIKAGGVAPDGTNRTNVYQLLLPEPGEASGRGSVDARQGTALRPGLVERQRPQSAAKAKRASRLPAQRPSQDTAKSPAFRSLEEAVACRPESVAKLTEGPNLPFSIDSWASVPPQGSPPDPLPGQQCSPSRDNREPPVEPLPVPEKGARVNPAAGPPPARSQSACGPLHREAFSEDITEQDADDALFELPEDPSQDCPQSVPNNWNLHAGSLGGAQTQPRRLLIELLRSWGVSTVMAAQLASTHSPEQIHAAVELARQAKACRRLRNPGGFIVRCLGDSWVSGSSSPGTPGSEVSPTRDVREQALRRREEQQALEVRNAADARIDELDDETIAHLAGRVEQMHAGRPSMLRLLRARPPRESRLMRAEIAALLETGS